MSATTPEQEREELPHWKTPEYRSWFNMKQRCTNPNNSSYKNYGSRGIEICEAWIGSFRVFLADMGTKPDETYSLDRIDVNGNYEPANCRWASKSLQCHNIRLRNRLGHRGVAVRRKKFQAAIRFNNKDYYLGVYDTVEQAAAAYQAKSRELYGN